MELKAVMYTKRFYAYLTEICHTLEAKALWKAPESLSISISEILQYDVAKFMLYVSSANGRLLDEHMMMYQIVTGYEGDQDQLHAWLCQHQIYAKDFNATLPLTFQIVREGEENAIARGISLGTEESITELFSTFFHMLGNLLFCDRVPQSSPNDMTSYRKTKNGFEEEPYNTMQEFYTLIDRLNEKPAMQ